jgi:hypothetical protein
VGSRSCWHFYGGQISSQLAWNLVQIK